MAAKMPPGLELVETIKLPGVARALAWDTVGKRLATGTDRGMVCIWDGELKTFRPKTLMDRERAVISVAWSPTGDQFAVGSTNPAGLVLFDQDGHVKWETHWRSDPMTVWSAAWSRDGRYFATGGADGFVTSGALPSNERTPLPISRASIEESGVIAWSPTTDVFARVQSTGISLVDPTGAVRRVSSAPKTKWTYALAWSHDGQVLASGGDGDQIYIWDRNLKERLVLEASFSIVESISFSRHGFLAARSLNNTVRIWKIPDWREVATLSIRNSRKWPAEIAFHPIKPQLAVLTGGDRFIHIFNLDEARLTHTEPRRRSERYQNAKVVLVGDTGVGKSGLATRLAGKPFRPTESTHGRRVLPFDKSSAKMADGHAVSREILLWDLAGQPGYRLVHQLQLVDAAIALILFDARSETDPFGSAAYWAQALTQARANRPLKKFLVAARSDRGGVGLSQRQIDEFVARHGFDGYFRTSAKTGEGVGHIATAIREAMQWDDFPVVASNAVFTEIMSFVKELKASSKKQRPLLLPVRELQKLFTKTTGKEVEEPEFDACLRRMADSDLVDILAFSTMQEMAVGTDMVLLEPAYVDAYASTIVVAAKDEPHGIGHLREADVLSGKFEMDKAERIPDAKAERLVLVATVELFLNHELALRERINDEDYLVFPSQYTRTSPFPGSNSLGVSYEFSGAIRNIFLTLIVRLAHSTEYTSRDFWRDAASFDSSKGGQCIIVFRELEDGRGRTTVFFEGNPPQDVQWTFLEYVFSHIRSKAVDGQVSRRRTYICPKCKYEMDDEVVERRLKRGLTTIVCPDCDTHLPLFDLLFSDTPLPERISDGLRRIDDDARIAKSRELAVTAIEGKRQTNEYDVFLSYNSVDREAIVQIATSLRTLGLRPWLDIWDLVPGRRWQDELTKAIPKVKSAAIFLGPNGLGPWHDIEMETFIEEFVRRRVSVMPVLLPGAQQAELPILLRGFMWVDLTKFKPPSVSALKNLVAGIIGRPPGEDIWSALEANLMQWYTGRDSSHREHRKIKLPIGHEPKKLHTIDYEAARAQLAERLGLRDDAVAIDSPGPPLRLVFDEPSDAMRLIKMIRNREPRIIEYLTRWKVSPERFLEENP